MGGTCQWPASVERSAISAFLISRTRLGHGVLSGTATAPKKPHYHGWMDALRRGGLELSRGWS